MQLKAISLSVAGLIHGTLLGCQASNTNPQNAALGAMKNTASTNGMSEMNLGRQDRLSVLTFNMQHRNNPKQLSVMADHLQSDLAETPDFILCQEVLFERSRNPEEANTAALLANDLDCHWRGTKRTTDHEGVAIISRYPFLFYDELHLKSQTSRLLLGFRRVSVMGEFQVPGTGLVRVVNVHFTNWGFERHVRIKQLAETLQWLAAREAQVHADVNILGGDFNIQFGSDELDLVSQGKYADLFQFNNFNTHEPTRGGKGKPNIRVDYIFVSSPDREMNIAGAGEQRLWLQGLKSPGKSKFWLSDHVPVLHEYTSRQPEVVACGEQPINNNLAQ